MAELEEFADRVVFLLDGRVYFDGSPASALARTGERTLQNAVARMMEEDSTCGRC
jgi:Cu-processing system ATP-binding protein